MNKFTSYLMRKTGQGNSWNKVVVNSMRLLPTPKTLIHYEFALQNEESYVQT